MTYFVAVSDNGRGELVPYQRADMERLMSNSREPHAVISRASAVLSCVSQTAEPAPKKTYKLNADVLFAFGKGGYDAITRKGRDELRRIAEEVRGPAQQGLTQVEVRGHTDPLGSSAVNLQLSKTRAATVKRLLIEEGIPARSIRSAGVGSANLVEDCSRGPATAERIACNAPNRRVEVSVEGARHEGEQTGK
jgi:OmpA-OmpF porin, OOP family